MNVFQTPVKMEGLNFYVTASVGISVYPFDGDEVDQLIKNADLAMFEAKNNGKNKAIFCTSEMKETVNRK